MTKRGTYLHLCCFSDVCNIFVKLLMYMRTSCIPMHQNIQDHPRLRYSSNDQTFKGKVKMTSPVTPETEMVQGPDVPCQKIETAMMEGLSD